MTYTEKRLETNIAGLIAKMKEEIQEHGDMHGANCPCNMEDPDECDCEEMVFWGQQIENYMVKVDQWWIAHAKEHRKLCTPDGNKMLTKMMGKKNRDTSIHQALAEERERERVREREEKYQQLIMAVTSAYKGETRHETALRYIQGAEISDIGQDRIEKDLLSSQAKPLPDK